MLGPVEHSDHLKPFHLSCSYNKEMIISLKNIISEKLENRLLYKEWNQLVIFDFFVVMYSHVIFIKEIAIIVRNLKSI